MDSQRGIYVISVLSQKVVPHRGLEPRALGLEALADPRHVAMVMAVVPTVPRRGLWAGVVPHHAEVVAQLHWRWGKLAVQRWQSLSGLGRGLAGDLT